MGPKGKEGETPQVSAFALLLENIENPNYCVGCLRILRSPELVKLHTEAYVSWNTLLSGPFPRHFVFFLSSLDIEQAFVRGKQTPIDFWVALLPIMVNAFSQKGGLVRRALIDLKDEPRLWGYWELCLAGVPFVQKEDPVDHVPTSGWSLEKMDDAFANVTPTDAVMEIDGLETAVELDLMGNDLENHRDTILHLLRLLAMQVIPWMNIPRTVPLALLNPQKPKPSEDNATMES